MSAPKTQDSPTPCLMCGSTAVGVVDSRPSKAVPGLGPQTESIIRRRRACQNCDYRWTTYEVPEIVFMDLNNDVRRAVKAQLEQVLTHALSPLRPPR